MCGVVDRGDPKLKFNLYEWNFRRCPKNSIHLNCSFAMSSMRSNVSISLFQLCPKYRLFLIWHPNQLYKYILLYLWKIVLLGLLYCYFIWSTVIIYTNGFIPGVKLKIKFSIFFFMFTKNKIQIAVHWLGAYKFMRKFHKKLCMTN